MYELWKNETGEVIETHPGPWADTQKRIAELNAKGLGVSARKAGVREALSQKTVVQESLYDAEYDIESKPVYVAYESTGDTLEVLGCSTNFDRLKDMYPNALIDMA